MNAKSIKKRLMRKRQRVLWGRRAYLTLRVPMALFPEPAPVFTPPGEPDGWRGGYKRVLPDGKIVHVSISQVSCGADPRMRPDEHTDTTVCFVEPAPYGGGWQWWEGVEVTCEPDDEDGTMGKVLERKPCDQAIIAQEKALDDWVRKYMHGMGGGVGNPVVDALLCVGNQAKSTHCNIPLDNPQVVYLTWSVKWFYPRRKFGFCAVLSRAMKKAKRAGFEVRLHR